MYLFFYIVLGLMILMRANPSLRPLEWVALVIDVSLIKISTSAHINNRHINSYYVKL